MKQCPTLCIPMDCSMPGFPVLHHLLEYGPVIFFCLSCYKKYQNGWLKWLYISVKIYFLTVLKKSKIKFPVDSFSDANFLVGFLMSAHLLHPYMVFAPCVCLEKEEALWSLFLFL